MKEAKYSAVGSSSSSSCGSTSSSSGSSSSSNTSSTSGTSGNAGDVVARFWNPTLSTHFSGCLLTGTVVSIMIFMQIQDSLNRGILKDIQGMIHPPEPPAEMDLPQYWNYSSHEFLPTISDWDEQRDRWIEDDPNLKLPKGSRPRVLMVTGSSQDEGEIYILAHLLLRAGKNKQDYTQMHDMELYYNMVNPDPEFSDWWVKVPVIRMLMLRRPEVEWIWWLDADAVITDMTFEPSFAPLDQHNLVFYGEDRLVHGNLDPRGLSTGAFMIRNCQWSLDLLSAWAYAGTDRKRREAGKETFQDIESNKTEEIVSGDDRSSLFALLAQDKRSPSGQQRWVPKVKFLKDGEYSLNGSYTVVGPKLEDLSIETDHVMPFITHFEGCLPNPDEVPKLMRQDSENFNTCVEQLERAFDFAENKVYKELRFERTTIGNSSEPFIWAATPAEEETTAELNLEHNFIAPVVKDWDQKRKAFLESRPRIRKDLTVIVSGSPSTPCLAKDGAQFLVRGLKNKIDFSRERGMRMFYNMAVIHRNLTGWWSKLPPLKLMMVNNIDAEWILWTDSDAVFTNMDFTIPFDRYNANGYNLVLYGNEHEVYDLKNYNGINTGSLLIRNCQWSFDLLDRWSSLSTMALETIVSSINRPLGWKLDDQTALVYLLVTERERWASQILLENTALSGDVVMSGDWLYWTPLFVDEYKMRADRRPFLTHFAGCHPCSPYPAYDFCNERYDRALNFADNQVLESFGLRHERLNSSGVIVDFLRSAQQWSHLEIKDMLEKASKGLAASNNGDVTTVTEEAVVEPNEEEVSSTKEGEELPNSKEQIEETTLNDDEKTDPTKKQVEVPVTEEGKVDSIDEQQEVEPTKEDEVVTTPKEEEKVEPTEEPTKENEDVSTTEEEQVEVTTTKEGATEDEKVETVKEQEDATIPKEEETVEPVKDQEDVTGDVTTPTDVGEKVEPTQEQEEGSTAQDEKVATTEKETVVSTEEEVLKVDPTKEQEGTTQPKKKKKKQKVKATPGHGKLQPGKKL